MPLSRYFVALATALLSVTTVAAPVVSAASDANRLNYLNEVAHPAVGGHDSFQATAFDWFARGDELAEAVKLKECTVRPNFAAPAVLLRIQRLLLPADARSGLRTGILGESRSCSRLAGRLQHLICRWRRFSLNVDR